MLLRRPGATDASRFVPNMDFFASMYVRKEALLSSQIEGAQCTLEDVLDPTIDAHANQDVADVVNYVRVSNLAVERLGTLPLCCRLLKEVHAELLQEVRGQEKESGEFRRSQNWIEPAGCTLADAASSIGRMASLHEKNLARLPKSTRRKDNVRAVFDYLEEHPIITIGQTAKALGISYNTVASCVEKIERLGILCETTNASRNRMFAYEGYLAILRPGT